VPFMRWAQSTVRLAALTVLLLLGADESDARPADGMTLGGAATNTFISYRVMVAAADSNGAGALASPMRAQVVPPYPGGSLSGLFNRGGMLGGFAAGFLGSGVLGLLFGRGLVNGLGGVPSYLGLIFQIALLLMLARLIWTRWRSDDALSPAGLSPRQLADPYLRSRDDLHAPIDPSISDDRPAETDIPLSERASKVTESRGRE
jgi:predicted lipid-binding transport protein (Tim44 family)